MGEITDAFCVLTSPSVQCLTVSDTSHVIKIEIGVAGVQLGDFSGTPC